MSRGLYARLAAVNIKKNGQFYFPYLLTGILTVAMFYIMCALQDNPDLQEMRGGADLKMIFGLGIGVIGIFAFIFLFYTNSFIIKRRKKELGIYNILGMEKKHLSHVLFLETLFTAVCAIGGGLISGILFNKLMCMLLYRLMGGSGAIGFYVSAKGIEKAFILFAGIYFLTLLYNMMQIKLANPIQLLSGGNVGEREPKTKWLLAVLGIICVGTGYYIAITVKNPLSVLLLFFVAVVLVIIGTYCLFTAGSIALLKLLRKKKSYYYQAKHFSAVSGMLYRMKQNAVGLANICILSTMVLVMVSGTVCLYMGTEDEINQRYPMDINTTVYYDAVSTDFTELTDVVKQTAEDMGHRMKDMEAYSYLSIMARREEGRILFDKGFFATTDMNHGAMLYLITQEVYEEQYDQGNPQLREDEVVVCSKDGWSFPTLTIGEKTYTVKTDGKLFEPNDEMLESMIGTILYVVVKDNTALDEIYRMQKAAYGEDASTCNFQLGINIDGTREEKIACGEAVRAQASAWAEGKAQNGDGGIYRAYTESREANRDSFRAMYSGFLFLGIFLGAMFLMITVLIIFYKQISEGYDDRERFVIMEKVGMSNEEVKATIRSQIRTVFFLPLATAAIHVTAAFPMIRRLLLILNMANVGLFALCMLGTIIIFALIYFAVFLLTSRTYYRLVGSR